MPNESWYVLVGGRQYGPYPRAAIEQFVAEGRLTPQSMLRQGETGGWAPAGQLLDFSHAPASASGSAPGGFPPAGPLGYASPPRSRRSTWVMPVVIGGVCLLLFAFCVILPMLSFVFLPLFLEHDVHELPARESRQNTKRVEGESNKAMNDFEIKGMKESRIEWKEKEAKARSPLDEPAVKPDGAKTPVEAEPEPRSP